MINKKISIVITGLVIIVGIFIANILSNQKEPMRRTPTSQNIKPVNIITIKNNNLQTEFEIGGHLAALDKAEIYAEVSGILLNTPKRYKEGTRYSKDETLIKIDDSVYKNNVLAQRSSLLNQLTLLLPDLSIDFPESNSRWNSYLEKFEIEENLKPLPEPNSDKERYYIASRNIFNQYYAVKSMEETLAKYTISAPYNGVVTMSNINPGTLVRVGQKLGEYTNTDVYELAASAGLHEIQHLAPGHPVFLISEDIEGQFDGRVQRINEVIDKTSQTVKVYITTKDKRLKDGMYCTALIKSKPISNSVQISRNLIVGNGHVYAVEDSTLTLKAVDIVAVENEKVIVKGLKDGLQIIGEPIAGAFEGMKINPPNKKPGRSKMNQRGS